MMKPKSMLNEWAETGAMLLQLRLGAERVALRLLGEYRRRRARSMQRILPQEGSGR
jgi:hypothetical protein